jgi:DNA-binding response OmpR family regulator
MEQSLHLLPSLQSGQSDQLVPAQRSSILVVSDDFNTRQQLVSLVRNLNYRSLRARSMDEAARALSQSPSLVIVDHRVQGGDGIGWIKWLREESVELGKKHYFSLPVIYCSNVNCSERNFNMLRNLLGVSVIVKKPLDTANLAAQIDHLVTPQNVLQFNPPQCGDVVLDSESASLDDNVIEADQNKDDTKTRLALVELGLTYLGDMPEILYGLRNHITSAAVDGDQAGRLQAAITTAHNIKGTAGSFGFRELSGMAAGIEELLRQYKDDGNNFNHELFADALIVVAEIEMWLEDQQDQRDLLREPPVVTHELWLNQNGLPEHGRRKDQTKSLKICPAPYKLDLALPTLRASCSRVKNNLADIRIEIGAGSAAVRVPAAAPAETQSPSISPLPVPYAPERLPLAVVAPLSALVPITVPLEDAPKPSTMHKPAVKAELPVERKPTVERELPVAPEKMSEAKLLAVPAVVAPVPPPAMAASATESRAETQSPSRPELTQNEAVPLNKEKCALVIGAKDVTESDMLYRALSQDGACSVESIACGVKALSRIEECSPAVLVLEAASSGEELSGLDLCRMVRCHPKWAKLKIIIMTEDASFASRQAIFKSGANDFVVRPLIEEELLIGLTNIVGGTD